MRIQTLKSAFAAGLLFAAVGCAPESDDVAAEDYAELSAARQEYVQSINGLKTVNGLTTMNGLKSVNGLTTMNGLKSVNGMIAVNGLKTVNGLKSVNGLKTVNGMTTINGLKAVNGLKALNGMTVAADGVTPVDENAELPVDCGATGIPGKDCWGYAEGILNPITGMLASDNGIATAKYLVRCALPPTDSINVVDYTGAVIHLKGEVGFTPQFGEGDCDTACQEKLSACLMAFTNGYGDHVQFEMSAQFTVGQGHSLPSQEAAFYGNMFLEPPQAFFCTGKDADGLFGWSSGFSVGDTRVCKGYSSTDCPYVKSGKCSDYYVFYFKPNKCDYNMDGIAPGTMTKCRATVTEPVQVPVTQQTCTGSFLSRRCTTTTIGYTTQNQTFEKTFNNPITTYVRSTSGS